MKVPRVNQLEAYLDPVSRHWDRFQAEDVAMMPTPLGMQPTEYIREKWQSKPYGKTPNLAVKVAPDSQTHAFHLKWFSGAKHPKDAAAIALPVRGNPILVMMGSKTDPIHFLHWMSGKDEVRSTFSQGIGTTQPGEDVLPEGKAEWNNGHWNVVITRALGAKENVAPLIPGQNSRIGFAIWNGANDERAGLKAFSMDWKELVLPA